VRFVTDGTKGGLEDKPIDVSHVLRVHVAPGAETEPDVFRTWSSCVLLTSNSRVYLDRSTSIEADRSLTGLGEKADQVIAEVLLDRPSLIYFTKAYADIVRRAFNSDDRSFPEGTWTVYGSDTRRNQETYRIESSLRGMVNILQAPFDFAWNFLRSQNRRIDYRREEEAIEEVANTRHAETVDMIIEEASKWMRPSSPRIIVLTLQEGEKSLWINVDEHSSGLNEIQSTCDARYANSTGSVFRGVMLAGLLWIDRSFKGDRSSVIMDSEFMNSLCRLASRAAVIKLRRPTVSESLPEIAFEFEQWKARLER
jgi:hypothetical protein